jgi:hypothetical protein
LNQNIFQFDILVDNAGFHVKVFETLDDLPKDRSDKAETQTARGRGNFKPTRVGRRGTVEGGPVENLV